MKKKYHKPKKLLIGLLIFSLSMLLIGGLIVINSKDGVHDSKDIIYVIGFIVSIIPTAKNQIQFVPITQLANSDQTETKNNVIKNTANLIKPTSQIL